MKFDLSSFFGYFIDFKILFSEFLSNEIVVPGLENCLQERFLLTVILMTKQKKIIRCEMQVLHFATLIGTFVRLRTTKSANVRLEKFIPSCNRNEIILA